MKTAPELFLIEGDLGCGSGASGKGGEQSTDPTYCVRPPGAYHGPFYLKDWLLPPRDPLLR